MKFCMSLIIAAAFALQSTAQITLEKSFSNLSVWSEVVLFSNNGKKIAVIEKGTNQLKLYDLNFQLWKTITVNVPSGYELYSALAISDNLFNTDNSIEFVAFLSSGTLGTKCQLINESGTVIQDFGVAVSARVRDFDNNNYKLFIQTADNGNYKVDIYSLPGTIPCDECAGSLGIGSMQNSGGSSGYAKAIPNPSTGIITVEYNIPVNDKEAVLSIFDMTGKVVKTFHINSKQTSIKIDNSTLPSGTYFYNIKSQSGITKVQKLVLIR